ncbi:competence type IV pilus ATPase ComGA [Fructilactobacillus florum]|uniref:Bacterial type II secretion system protein E domain-containing protein n=1 Tax=Fructilactobacillus florum DSM 22689 = JCM 16035 TaxID=1423745 RepID=A0A0R2CMK9_9LACO|nr:competence type IV pilus ATPase ComGA [Fructilactobacillus florum]EKK20931.1 Late competence protein ComGA, access of DNA to ComEA [Fructilactobacillus florum 2F]KRM92400.1 hypothetical protein FC87_GL000012 [Fructilactobacillus florum DSM 22689 = JCM 16035]
MEITNLFAEIMRLAVAQTASDIYFLPKAANYEVRMHTSKGVIQLSELSFTVAQRLITYCKYQSGMAISEKRRPQLGTMTYSLQKERLRLRLSTVGNFNGHESLVLRVIYQLDQQQVHFFAGNQQQHLQQLMQRRGLFLFAGPTGAGKTTTIYQLARSLPTTQVVLAIEDPVEIYEERFLQLEVNPPADMSFESLLKIGLRERPDVFIIGEIRDRVSANIAVRAALSGHLVFSTVHARSPLKSMQRLLELGVKQSQLEAAVSAIVYQRLLPTTTNQQKALLTVIDHNFFKQPAADLTDWRKQLLQLEEQGVISRATQMAYHFG